ncbi:MAG: hypothetical protein AAFQ36_02015 [Pseudomonadota bacterium]
MLLLAVGLAARPLLDADTRWWVERGLGKFADRLEVELSRVATPAWTDTRVRQLLTESPRDWAKIEMLVVERAVSEELRTQLAEARAQDFSLVARTGRCAACLWDAATCSVTNLLMCRLPLDITPVGDVAALARGGVAVSTGQDVDELDVAIGAAGLSATLLIPFTGGASAPVKAGTSVLRTAKAAGRVTPELTRVLRTADPSVFRPLAASLGDLRAEVGLAETVRLLRHVGSVDDAALVARTSRALGPRTVLAFEALGKSRIARLGLRLSDDAISVVAGVGGAVLALVSLITGAAQGSALSAVRRLLRSRG